MINFRDFLVFLSENKCLGAYWSYFEGNYFADDYHSAALTFSYIFDYSPRSWLLGSFDWDRTKEGYDYWCRLHALWDRRCDDLFKQRI